MTIMGRILRGVVGVGRALITGQVGNTGVTGGASPVQLQQNTATQAVTFPMKWLGIGIAFVVGIIILVFTLGKSKR